ncbi:uncharacterized protein LOC114734788 [Neltuma alba]|uniref:uncharacterized protein LOC114721421 n=1 Tax=Neltuma alba TaxID=207710 RepID=UPI0010A59CEC|nr:uncharacterized protein LOC114721421 [Prosopis alba]XP_028778265.1 uncharacterized protein LOC114734788 [Prosopis alba]
MGRHIIREQSPEDPEKRSRLWSHDDVLDVLRNCTGTIAIKGLALNMSANSSRSLGAKAFENMKKLRLLQLDHVQLVGDFDYLSKDLRSPEVLEARPSTSQDLCGTQGLIGFQEKSHMERLEPLSSLTIHLGGFNKVMDALLNSISQGWSDGGFDYSQLPQDNYPDWLCFESEGSSASFKMPRVVGRLMGMVIYIIYSSSQDSMASVYPVGFMIKNFTKGTMDFYKRDDATTSTDDDWHKITLNLEPDDDLEIIVNFAQKHIVKKTLIYLVYNEGTKLSITPSCESIGKEIRL